jgi:hypothetical protein
VLVVRRATIEEDDAKALGYGDKENMSESMKEFAEEGYPSDEDDIKDPRERDKAMKEAVGDVLSMAQSEADVINQAYDLIEKLSPGLKLKNRPPRSEGEEGKEGGELSKGMNACSERGCVMLLYMRERVKN